MSHDERFTLRAAAYLLLIKNGKILLSRRSNTAWRNGEYSLIAGHLDPGESIRTTMIREAKEEAGITLQLSDLKFVHVMQQYENAEYFDFYFTADKWGASRPTASQKNVMICNGSGSMNCRTTLCPTLRKPYTSTRRANTILNSE